MYPKFLLLILWYFKLFYFFPAKLEKHLLWYRKWGERRKFPIIAANLNDQI